MFEIINWNINQGWESITSIITQTNTLRRVKRGNEEGYCQFNWNLLSLDLAVAYHSNPRLYIFTIITIIVL